MTPRERWLIALWPFVHAWLPSPPGRVLEIGCGPLGGFIPALRRGGYDAVGIDPEAPEAPGYHRIEFERYDTPQPADGAVACTSLHHVADPDDVLDRVQAVLRPGGGLVVVEWAWERFDQATAQWCFTRLAPPSLAAEPGWLHRRHEEWAASGQPWNVFLRTWAETEGLHQGREILRGLDVRFDRQMCSYGPYFFPDLADVSEADEQAAIDDRRIQATGIRYVGRLR
jgi:SAM-dependent methyltransferase